VSSATAAPPTDRVTVAVIVDVLVPLPAMGFGTAVTVTLFVCGVWVMTDVPVLPPLASVTVTVQLPPIADAVYVVVNFPVPSVLPVVGLKVPQEAVPLVVSSTGSLKLAVPVTWTVNVNWVALSAGTVAVAGVIAVVFPATPADCVMLAVPVPPEAKVLGVDEVSVAVSVQNPTVVLDV
jgi:hypothetical protein